MDPISLAKFLREGGLVGALALALVIIAFLFRELLRAKAELLSSLSAEKDAHRATAMDIIPIARDMARLVEALNSPSRRARNVRATGPASGGGRGPSQQSPKDVPDSEPSPGASTEKVGGG